MNKNMKDKLLYIKVCIVFGVELILVLVVNLLLRSVSYSLLNWIAITIVGICIFCFYKWYADLKEFSDF